MTSISNNTSIVTTVRVVAHTTGPMGGTSPMSENHWSIYLLLATGGSVRLNMRADYGDPTGRLELSMLGYTSSNSALRYWDYPAAIGTTVKGVLDIVTYQGRQHYWMSGGGSGCRYWVWTVVTDLGQWKYLAPDAGSQLWPNLLHLYSRSGETRDLGMVEGSFAGPSEG